MQHFTQLQPLAYAYNSSPQPNLRLQKIIELSRDHIVLLDAQGKLLYANPVEPLLGYALVDYLNLEPQSLIHPADQAQAEAFWQAVYATPNVTNTTELRYRHSQGYYVWLEVTATNLLDDPEVCAVLTYNRMVEHKQQERQPLFENEKLLRTVIENLPVGVWLLDLTGKIIQTNPAGEQIWHGIHNVKLEELTNVYKAWWADTGKLLQADEWADIRALTLGETTLNQELEIEAFDGAHKYILSSAIPLCDAHQNIQGAMVVNQDITERKRNEKLIRQALEKEKELSELKSRFVSMASHEFRTPLATIRVLTDTLAAYWPKLTEEQIQQRFNKVKEQIDHLKRIMEDVLQLARMQAKRVEFQPVLLNLDELCRKFIAEFEDQLKFGQVINYRCINPPAYTLNADPKLLRQIVSNLLSNAIKYSAEGKPIRVNLDYIDHKFSLTIQDEGIGIPQADLNHLFEPFHRASNVRTISGTGLGMVITKEAVELHGGSITVESAIGVGSTFTLRFPPPEQNQENH